MERSETKRLQALLVEGQELLAEALAHSAECLRHIAQLEADNQRLTSALIEERDKTERLESSLH
jgi:hypothetical protein